MTENDIVQRYPWELRGICFFSNKVKFIDTVLLTGTVVGVVRSRCVNNLFVCSSFSLYRFVANIYSCIIYNLVVCITPLICVKNAARSAVHFTHIRGVILTTYIMRALNE
jgi:hypothetical protein